MGKTALIIIVMMGVVNMALAQPGLKINEVDYDQPGTDNAEFIEMVNTSSSAVDLQQYTVILFNGMSSSIYDSVSLPFQSLNPGEFFVICGNSGMVINCGLVFPAASDIIQNGSPDAVAIWENTSLNIVDVVSYEGSSAPPWTEGTGLPTAQSDNNTDSYLGLSRYPDGNDTQDNSADFIQACITPGTINTNISSNCQNPVSVQDNALSVQRIYVFPNPSASVVSFFGLPPSRSGWEITFCDITGKCAKKIFVSAANGIINTNISSLDAGMYLVTARTDDAPAFVGKLKVAVTR